ncbi:prealbumin-like fold domain-containing protein [Streptomyces sp. enrichment culture]|uniref:prealbumin-like fold domain-containing protein n=1 Tax=Streptomyces sp. enrichment culture TaxID=1795815 RepID=UPI003F5529D1
MRATARSQPARSRSLGARCRSSLIAVGMATAMSVSFAGTAVADTAGPPSGDGEQPVLKLGNVTCADVLNPEDFLFEHKHEPVVSVTDFPVSYTDPDTGEMLTGLLDVTVSSTLRGPVFRYNVTGDLIPVGVVVKGGPNANFYDYRPGGNANDSYLHAPVNDRNNKFFGLSHVSFCFDEVKPGALQINKNSSKGGSVLAEGAKFAVNGPSLPTETVTDTQNTPMGEVPDEDPATGVVCISGLRPGNYTVSETQAPPGYARDTTTKTVTVVPGTDCNGNRPAGTSTGRATFVNKPLADVDITVTGQQPGEINSKIVCRKGTTVVGNSGAYTDPANLTMTGLKPGIYTCTLDIDP